MKRYTVAIEQLLLPALTVFSKRNATFLKLAFFWRRVYTSESGAIHDPRLHDPDPGPQDKSTKKSCVSFGKDCTMTIVVCHVHADVHNHSKTGWTWFSIYPRSFQDPYYIDLCKNRFSRSYPIHKKISIWPNLQLNFNGSASNHVWSVFREPPAEVQMTTSLAIEKMLIFLIFCHNRQNLPCKHYHFDQWINWD